MFDHHFLLFYCIKRFLCEILLKAVKINCFVNIYGLSDD